MEGRIPRRGEHNKTSEIVTIVTLISSTRLRGADAILVVTGEGEHDRVFYGVELWRQDFGQYLLVTRGSRETEKMFGAHTKESIAQLCQVSSNDPRIIVAEEQFSNTLKQANWAVNAIAKKPIKNLIIVSAAYHLPRVLLTLLKTLQKKQLRLTLIPSAAPLVLPRDYLLIPGEVKRIIRYQAQGDIATVKELYDHFVWQLSQQPQPFQEFQRYTPMYLFFLF